MKSTFKLFILLFLSVFLFQNCDPEETGGNEEEELITDLTYTLTPDAGGAAVVLTFSDPDGDGGDDPVIQGGTLKTGVYSGTIELSNTSETPAEDITAEIREEDEEHQFFFSSSEGRFIVSYDDSDSDGNPIGLQSKLTAVNNLGSDQLTIILRHEPDKAGLGVSGGNIVAAGGETDIEVTFPITITE